MNEKIIIQITNILKEGLSSIDAWEKAVFAPTITRNDSVSFDLTLFQKGEEGKRFFFDNLFKTRDLILELNKDSNEIKWNKAFFVVHANEEYESEFIWDEKLYMQHEFKLARASVTLLYERFYEILTFEILEEKRWETAIVTSLVKNKSSNSTVEVIIEGQKFNYNIILSERWEEHLLNFHEETNVGILKNIWPKWNCMKIKMLYEDRLDKDKDVSFTVE